ncbi:large conductance mechanosensitive channel protein MscL [Aquihabitans daechungensis]|uniref:large conductance mechanosensitive channel protein MscL n=1 Tax=Aquihabitans daechungensis TaxID=1052257 RepID=UPI003BA30253
MLEGFKKFIIKGNVVDLAVGIVIGAAFASVISQFTASFITPLIGVFTGGGGDGGSFTISDEVFTYGAFFAAVIGFAITAAVIYFLVVVPMNHLNERRAKGEEAEVEPTNEEKVVALLEVIAAKP